MNIDNENENTMNSGVLTEDKKESVSTAENDQTESTEKMSNIDQKSDEGSSKETAKSVKSPKPKKSNSVLKSISLAIKTVLWSLIVIALTLLLITVASKKTDIFGYRMYLIMSGSMEPTINIKDAIITKQIDEPQNGDIIAFESGNMVTVHRIIKVYTEGDNRLYQTKGDNNNAEDPGLVQKTQIKGKVKYVLPFVGRAVLFLQSHFIGLILAIGIVAIIIIARRLI